MIRLAAPVVLAELGWMTMGMVDTLMVGRLSPEAIGAVGVGSSLFMGVAIFAMGLMLGLDTLVSQRSVPATSTIAIAGWCTVRLLALARCRRRSWRCCSRSRTCSGAGV